MEKVCGCGSKRFEAGQFDGMALTLQASSLRKKVFNVGGQLHCMVCMDCGAISDLKADPKKLEEMLEK